MKLFRILFEDILPQLRLTSKRQSVQIVLCKLHPRKYLTLRSGVTRDAAPPSVDASVHNPGTNQIGNRPARLDFRTQSRISSFWRHRILNSIANPPDAPN